MARSWEKKRGRPEKLNKANVIAALRATAGIKTAAARQLNVSRATLYRFIERYPDVRDVIREIDEEVIDFAEGEMIKAMRAGDGQMIRYYLDRKAKHRGYTVRVEKTGPNGGPIETRSVSAMSASLESLPREDRKSLREIIKRNAKQEG